MKKHFPIRSTFRQLRRLPVELSFATVEKWVREQPLLPLVPPSRFSKWREWLFPKAKNPSDKN